MSVKVALRAAAQAVRQHRVLLAADLYDHAARRSAGAPAFMMRERAYELRVG